MANKLYSQKILSERQINLSPTDSKFPYAGLHAIMRHPLRSGATHRKIL